MAAALACAAPAAAQSSLDDAGRGRQLAEIWCVSCHVVSADQKQATTVAPPFATIAERSSGDFGWVAAFLADPHPPMPKLSLTRREIRELAAYIESLAPAR